MIMEPSGAPEGERVADPLGRLRYAAVALDRAGMIRSANAKAVALLGVPAARLEGSPLRGRSAPGDEPDVIRPPRLRSTQVLTRWMDGADGEQVLIRVEIRRDRSREAGRFIAVLGEATSSAKVESEIEFERSTLGLIAAGLDAPVVFAHAGRALEEMLGGSLAFFAADRALTKLSLVETDAVAPAIAKAFAQGIPISPDAPACGQAAARKRPVIVRDLAAGSTVDSGTKQALLEHGARACWSVPVLTESSEVLGTIGAFHPEPRAPRREETALLEKAASLAALVLARRRSDEDGFALEHRYRTLATMSSDFAYCFEMQDDGPPRLAWVTDAFQRITSYEPEEWVRAGAWRGIIHPDDLLAFEQRLPRLMGGEEVTGEFRIVTKSGEVRWLSVLTRPIVDPASSRVTSIIGSAHDFTARKEAEDTKTMFLATASHELKTPLTVIQGFAQMLGTGHADEEIGTEAVGAIRRRAVQLNKIIDRILLSSRIETGRAPVTLTAVDPRPILDELVDSLGGASQRDIAVEAGEIPLIKADADAFTTVIDHLLDNAVKYSPDGGKIRVLARGDQDRVLFEVADEGIGMTEAQVERCFEKFWQAESSDVRRFGGTGIGLFIVRSLVEAMGGGVEVTSSPGKGTRFTIALPRAPEPAEHEGQPREPSIVKEFMRQLGIPARREP